MQAENHHRLIVGLGNPGKDYELTRHNLGFLVVEQLAKKWQFKFRASRLCKGFVADGQIDRQKVSLLLPTTYMNLSGLAVKSIIEKKELFFEDLLVVCDDVSLDFGQLRIRPDGSAGGHNGLSSIVEQNGTKEFARLRMGVGRPLDSEDLKEYVLGQFSVKEKKDLPLFIEEGVICCEAWLTHKMSQVMSQFNKRKANE